MGEATQSEYERKIAQLEKEIDRLLRVNAEYKRQAIEWANEIARLEKYIEELRFNHPL